MGLLPMQTVFRENKTRTRVTGTFQALAGSLSALSGTELEGYEIHMGTTTLADGAKPLVRISDQVTGSVREDGAYRENVYGSYVHGIFDREEVVKKIVEAIGAKKGIDVSQMSSVDFAQFKETQYDLLAQGLREHLDMKKIYEILDAGV